MVMLDEEPPDGRLGCSERNSEPRTRRRTNEFDFTFRRQTIELALRNQHRRARPENKRGAAASYLLWCRRHIDLVSEKWKCKGVRFGVMESDEAILRVENFLQRLMDAPQEFIQVCGFVEGMHDLGDDLSLGFHPVKIGDVPKTDDNAPDGRQVGMIAGGSIEPAPTPVFAPQPAAAAKCPTSAGGQTAKTFANFIGILCVQEVDNRSSGKTFARMAHKTSTTCACTLNGAVRAENCDQLPDRVQQRGELLRAHAGALRKGGTLVHLVAARDTSLRKRAPRARVRPAFSVRS